jgi:hypothetical protein
MSLYPLNFTAPAIVWYCVSGVTYAAGGPVVQQKPSSEALLRLTPMACATPEQLRLLGREPIPFERDASMLVQWSAIPEGIFQIRCPEAILSLKNPRASFHLVRGQRWTADSANAWKFDNPLQVAHNTMGQPTVPYKARLRGWVRAAKDHVNLRFQLVNETEATLEPQVLWVCFMHGLRGPKQDQVAVPGISKDSFFQRDGQFLPWRTQETEFKFMPANGSALTKAGWQQYEDFKLRGPVEVNIRAHAPAEGLRAALVQRGTQQLVVGLRSADALILGGKCEYPCTDLGLGLDPLKPGDTAEVRATAWFLSGGLRELARH